MSMDWNLAAEILGGKPIGDGIELDLYGCRVTLDEDGVTHIEGPQKKAAAARIGVQGHATALLAIVYGDHDLAREIMDRGHRYDDLASAIVNGRFDEARKILDEDDA